MDPTTDNQADSAHWHLDEVMEIASRLAGHDVVGSIHVVLGERPTYDALLHYRQLAEASGLTLTLTADSVVLRPPHPPEPRAIEDIPTRAPGRWTRALRTIAGQFAVPRHSGDRSAPRTS